MPTDIFDCQLPVNSRLLQPPSFFKKSTEKMISKNIVIGGSSANPPHLDYYSLLEDIRFNDSLEILIEEAVTQHLRQLGHEPCWKCLQC